MDWFSWLSKTSLESSTIHEYALAFSHNQLQQEDISYFNHEFLQSMGIAIAKHRLEILKLSKASNRSNPITKLTNAIKKTRRSLASYVRKWVQSRRESSALVTVKRRSYSLRWKGTMMRRGSATLLLTNGNRRTVARSGGAKVTIFSSPVVYDLQHDDSDYDSGEDGGGGGYWNGGGVEEEIKWDTMFQNLKPT